MISIYLYRHSVDCRLLDLISRKVTAVLIGRIRERHSEILAVDVADGTDGVLKPYAHVTVVCTVKCNETSKSERMRVREKR
jgi:hypothetical protein